MEIQASRETTFAGAKRVGHASWKRSSSRREGDFEPSTWQAFTRFALEGRPAAQVAGELGVTESAVVQAKFRILKRLREEAGELRD